MTYSVKEQLRKVRRMRRELRPKSRTLLCVVEQGEPVPEDIMQQARPGDTILVEEIPKGYFDSPIEPVGERLETVGSHKRIYGVNTSRV